MYYFSEHLITTKVISTRIIGDYLYALRDMDNDLCHVLLTSLLTYGCTKFLLLTGILLNRSSTEVEKNCSPRIAI